jgi:uncharacterized protein with FMN-binding domain
MRRVILTVTATVAGLIALLSFKTHSSDPERTVSSPTSTQPTLQPGEHAVTGNVANTIYGPVQVQVLVKSHKIVKVSILESPQGTNMDVQIGQFAFPKLISETLSMQSARIDSVSGATYTSGGYIKSLQSALDNGA